MKKLSLFCLLSLLLFPLLFFRTILFAQELLPPFGSYGPIELQMKECSFDKNAEAVVLFDDAKADYDDDYHLITIRRVRIKILNDRGLGQGNIRIRFFSKGNFEDIQDINAQTINLDENGKIITTSLSPKAIFTEKEDQYYSSKKFAFPNVRAGSIIEYSYLDEMKSYGGLESWNFQREIPTLRSSYKLRVPPNSEFDYLVQKKSFYPITISPVAGMGVIYYEMDDIPALRFEPYMDAVKDYLQRVEFQFSGYVNEYGTKKNVNQTWNEVAISLADDDNLGGALKKSLSNTDEIKSRVEKDSSGISKLSTIYNYVRDNFTWNNYNGKYASDGLKKIWEKKSGSNGEINLLLVRLLLSFDIEAYPLLAADRDFGKIDPKFPFIDRFNKTVAYAIVDGKAFIMDATEKYCPYFLTPYSLLNTFALIVDKKKSKLIEIKTADFPFQSNVNLEANINNEGLLNGIAEITSSGYGREQQTEEIKQNDKKFFSELIAKQNQGLALDSFYYSALANENEPLRLRIRFKGELNESGGFLSFNYNLFTELEKNPFTSGVRFTNIDFGFPFNITLTEKIGLPVKYKVDDLPKDKTLRSERLGISLSRKIRFSGNSIEISLSFSQTQTWISSDSYDELKSFYRDMTTTLNEPVVVKIAK